MGKIVKLTIVLICLFSLGILKSQAQTSSFATNKNPARFEYQLSELNALLEDFADGYFGKMEVVDGYVVIRFQEGKYSMFKVEDMAMPVLDERWGQVNWDCKNESLCVETDWNDEGKESGILFSELGSDSLDYLMELLNNFIAAYKGK
jgi:hypothetical protein